MSLGSRVEDLEDLLASKYELSVCEDSEKGRCASKMESCIARILANYPTVSRYDLIEAISDRFSEYKRARLRAQRRKEGI